ncbi:hypothetical protein CATYP_02825 [Corynebacterium atypicum]|uniref:Zinc-finger domain-containing protein n=1 Tax=Corynebacterium atypicum TaxID=191610 RepID=A0ABN4DC86_9CORY|nr:hypothetical protein CATYP_02825 [Corynebacterium atypicum]
MGAQPSADGNGCNCAELESRLVQLLDAGLPAGECARLRAEILSCPACAARLEREEALRALLRSCCHATRAPQSLKARVSYQLRVTRWSW